MESDCVESAGTDVLPDDVESAGADRESLDVESIGALEARESVLVESDLADVLSASLEFVGLVGELPSASSASGIDPQAAKDTRAASASIDSEWVDRNIDQIPSSQRASLFRCFDTILSSDIPSLRITQQHGVFPPHSLEALSRSSAAGPPSLNLGRGFGSPNGCIYLQPRC